MRYKNRVRELRLKRGWSIKQLHEESGVSYGHISDIERDKHTPGVKTGLKLAAALGVPFHELIRLESDNAS